MKFLNWTGVTLVGLPTVALAGFVIYKVATKKKGGQRYGNNIHD